MDSIWAKPYTVSHCILYSHSCIMNMDLGQHNSQVELLLHDLSAKMLLYSVKLGFRTEILGPKLRKALASTCGLRRSLDGCLKFGGPDGVGESGVELRRSLRKARAS